MGNVTTDSTRQFAEFVENIEFEQLPNPVVSRTKEILFDGLGALLAATSPRYDVGNILRQFVEQTNCNPEARVFGTSLQTDCANAALVNGTFGYYCDIESIHPESIMHAIAIVGPAALAVGEKRHSAGREVLSAIIVGIDVACRVGCALGGSTLYDRGFHPSSVAGTFGAMAAAGRLLGLQDGAWCNAFGLAGLEASGLLSWVSDSTEHSRPYNIGLAAKHGVTAAHLASLGFGGPPNIFEGKYSLGQAFTGQWNEEALFKGLGETFKVMELCIKRYACCAFIHPGLDGLLDIRNSENLGAEDVERITLHYPESGYKVIDGNSLRSHNAQYVMALAMDRGRVEFNDILHDQRFEPQIRELSERARVLGDDELDREYPELYRSIVEVELSDGVLHRRDITHPKGHPENPLTNDELREKFASLTQDVLTPKQAEEIANTVGRLEELKDIRTLTKLLTVETHES